MQAGLISMHEAEEMVLLALELRDTVKAWLSKAHPELMAKGPRGK